MPRLFPIRRILDFSIIMLLSRIAQGSATPLLHNCDVEEEIRKGCGFPGISADQCEQAGCCFRSNDAAVSPECYYGAASLTHLQPLNTPKNYFTNVLKTSLRSFIDSGNTPYHSIGEPSTRSSIPTAAVEEDEKACLKTFELFLLTPQGNYECSVASREKVECFQGHVYRESGESECTACTKMGCCYDQANTGRGTPSCYRSKPRSQSTISSNTLSTGYTTKPIGISTLTQQGAGQLPHVQKQTGGRNTASVQNHWQQPTNSIFDPSQAQNIRRYPFGHNNYNGQFGQSFGMSQLQPAPHPTLVQSGVNSLIPGSPVDGNDGNIFGGILGVSTVQESPRNNIQNLLKFLSKSSTTSSSGPLNIPQSSNTGRFPFAGLPNNPFLSLLSNSNGAVANSLSGQPQASDQFNNVMSIYRPGQANTAFGSSAFGNIPYNSDVGLASSSSNIGSLLAGLNGATNGLGNVRFPGQSFQLNQFSSLRPRPDVAPGVGIYLPGLPSVSNLMAGNQGSIFQTSMSSTNDDFNNKNSIYDLLFSGLAKPSHSKTSDSKTTTTKPPPKSEQVEPAGGDKEEEKTFHTKTFKKVSQNVVSGNYEKADRDLPEKTCYPDNCGTLGNIKVNMAAKRIVGGQWAGGIHYWPWMASFRRNFTDDPNFNHVCGAALISNNWIVTAGHCFVLYRSKAEKISGSVETKINSFVIWFGTYVREGVELTTQIGVLEKFVAHPKYDFDGLEYDIAVAKLQEEVTITDHVRPVCLPPTKIKLEVGARTWVTGWGRTLRVGNHNESKLKELPLPLTSFDECKSQWTSYQSDDWICTEGAYLEDACTGDSGGPLVHQINGKSWEIVGVAIAGTKRCSTQRSDIRPGIYTNVAYYREFIDVTTNGTC